MKHDNYQCEYKKLIDVAHVKKIIFEILVHALLSMMRIVTLVNT